VVYGSGGYMGIVEILNIIQIFIAVVMVREIVLFIIWAMYDDE
jgi:hypothetical protein